MTFGYSLLLTQGSLSFDVQMPLPVSEFRLGIISVRSS